MEFQAADPPENWFNIFDEALEVAEDGCCRICLLVEPDPRDTEALRLLDIGEEIPQGVLVPLGCSCMHELSLVHYWCALRWFDIKGVSIPCELCGAPPSGISRAHRLKFRRFQYWGSVVMKNRQSRYPRFHTLGFDDETLARMVAFAELLDDY